MERALKPPVVVLCEFDSWVAEEDLPSARRAVGAIYHN
jgi:hypothetical protein